MAEDERTKKNNELKIKKRDYTGYDDEEFVPGHEGMKRSVLSKYDEDIDGVQETVSIRSMYIAPNSRQLRDSAWETPLKPKPPRWNNNSTPQQRW